MPRRPGDESRDRAAWAGRRSGAAPTSLAVLALALPCAGGCDVGSDGAYYGTTVRRGKAPTTFYENNASEPEYLDPGKANDSASTILAFQMFEGLTAYHPKDLHPVQAMATHWEQTDDNRMYRFHLREARWSDGRPVRAQDFEYAWKRVLRPSFASRAASSLYPLLNAEKYSLGHLKTAARAVTPTREPREGAAPAGAELGKGAAVEIVATSPMKVQAAVAPLGALPADTKAVGYSKADAKRKTPEQLSLGLGRPVLEAGEGSWKGAEVVVIALGPAVTCNGEADHWLELAKGDAHGWLPGCMLGPAKSAKSFALVAAVPKLPTYAPRPADPTAEAEPKPLGFVPVDVLVEDDSIVGVRAADDRTLDVELERPTPFFTDLTSLPTLAPVRQDVVEPFEKRGEPEMWTRPESIVVNGPYTLDTWKFRYELTMKKNPQYWAADTLKIDRIVWTMVEEQNAGLNLYKAGELDYIGDNVSIPLEHMKLVENKKDFIRNFFLSTYWYEFNTKAPPVDDVRVRRALNLAVDKKQLVEKVTRGGQIPATHFVPDFTGLGYADQVAADKAAHTDPFDTSDTNFNPERARELLREAGYDVRREGDGWRVDKFPSLEILYNTGEGHKQIAVALQDMWKRHLGISVTLRNEEWKVMLKNVRDGHFQVVRFGWVADYNHPHTWLDTFLSSSPNNSTGWSDKEFDEMLRRAAETADPKESIRRYRDAEKRAVDGMAKMPLYFYTRSVLVKPWVKGFTGNARSTHLVKWLWIDPAFRDNPDNSYASPGLELPPPGRIGSP